MQMERGACEREKKKQPTKFTKEKAVENCQRKEEREPGKKSKRGAFREGFGARGEEPQDESK